MGGPFVIIALSYSGGLILGNCVPLSLAGLLTAAITLAVAAVLFARVRRAALWALVPLFGWTNLASRTAILSPHDLRLVLGDAPACVDVRGALVETPVVRVYERGTRIVQRSTAEIEVRAVRRSRQEWEPALGRVAASTPGSLGSKFFAGRTVVVTGVIQRPSPAMAPGQFDYRGYLHWRGVYHQLRCENTNDWRLHETEAAVRQPNCSLSDRFCRWAQSTLSKGLPAEDESLRLLWAMVGQARLWQAQSYP